MDQQAIERIVRRGGHFLAETLDVHWPTNGDNEVGERNITLQLTRSFSAEGFYLYAECHTEGSTETRADLVALHPQNGVEVIVEAKRLKSLGVARRDAP